MGKPLVSIVMITYNHEKFISKAIESIMMQKTNFDFQLLIGEDCSKDQTLAICKDYKSRYPDKITLFERKVNKGMNGQPNLIDLYSHSVGSKYVALCEGDDFWISADKLQRQVDFLEKNDDFSICFHNAKIEYFDTNEQGYLLNENIQKDVFTIEDLIGEDEIWFMATASVMYRHASLPSLPNWFHGTLSGDIPMHILAARYGKIKYLPEVMSVYNKNLNGTSFSDNTSDKRFLLNRIFMYSKLNLETGRKYDKIFKKNISRYYRWLLDCKQIKDHKIQRALYAIKYLLLSKPDIEVVKQILKKYIVPNVLLSGFRLAKKVKP